MNDFEGCSVVVTGGTDGIGAATALELRRRGADVVIVGRLRDKADAIVAAAARLDGHGSLTAVVADFALMRNVERIVSDLRQELGTIDVLVHAVGILIARTEHTAEGIEKDFAIGYLSRFVFTEAAADAGLLSSSTRMVNIAASAPSVPRWARLDFSDLDVVRARTGMTSHGQAQLANDLFTAQAGKRYAITAIGYGPGAVDTSIRREIPSLVQTVMRPFFRLRRADDVARQIAQILSDRDLRVAGAAFFNARGRFEMSDYVADTTRQRQLLAVSSALSRVATAGS